MSLREEQCKKVCRILDNVLANRPTERDSLIVATRKAFKALAEPKRGRWEMGKDERFVECSECGLMTTRNELRGLAVFGKNEPNFCPNCGAEMREVTT